MKSFNQFSESNEFENNDIMPYLRDYIKGVDSDWNYITPDQLSKKDLSKLFILDIRRKEDYKSGHIKGAKNIFWMDLLDNLDKLPKDEKIYLVCYVGHTASQMMVVLRLLGYDVVALKFGMGKSPVDGVPVAGWLDWGFDVK